MVGAHAVPGNTSARKLGLYEKPWGCISWYGPHTLLVNSIIRWRSISMRAGPAFLQFDWSKAGLSMDLPVFVYSHTKTSSRFLSRQRKYREAFYVVTDLLLQATQREPYRALVLSRLRLLRSTDHQDRSLHSLSHRFQSSCS